jgi:hypothetical protein
MEQPSPKKQKLDSRLASSLTIEDQEVLKKAAAHVTVAFEKHLRLKNFQKSQVDGELKELKEVVKKDPTLRLFVKRIALSVPLEAIKVLYFFLKIISYINFVFLRNYFRSTEK